MFAIIAVFAFFFFFFFQAEDGIRDLYVTGVQTCALPIFPEGQSLDRTIAAFTEMAKRISTIPEVVFVEAYTQGLTYHGHLYISLKDRRSEERRVGKECRSRWSPNH